MLKKQNKQTQEGSRQIQNDKLSIQERIELFYNKYRTFINYGFSAILILVAGYFGYRYFILMPMEEEARHEIYNAQYYFERDSLNLALYGRPGEFLGFTDIAEDYSKTQTGNLAKYYSGIILLQQGKYNEALYFLKSFKTRSQLLEPLTYGAIGDAYSQLGEYHKAAKYYMRAASRNKNQFTSPLYYMKAGIVYEELGNYKTALTAFKAIRNDFPDTEQAIDIEKYIGRVEARIISGRK